MRGRRDTRTSPRQHGLAFAVGQYAIPPVLLYVRGAPVREALLQSVSVVGSRAATAQGAHIARRWSAELAEGGDSIVSGAAFGIDAAAHHGALAA